MDEEKPTLTEEELKEYTTKSNYDLGQLSGETLLKIKNTIEELEAEFKSVKGLKNFITTGVLVNPNLILAAEPDEYGIKLGMTLTSISGHKGMSSEVTAVTVDLRVQDVDRLIRILPELLKAARLHRDFQKLQKLHKDKSDGRRRF